MQLVRNFWQSQVGKKVVMAVTGLIGVGFVIGHMVGNLQMFSDPAKIKSAVKETEFNDYHVTVKGHHVTVKVNGETMVDDDFPTLPGKDKKPFPADGIIAWQAHAGYKSMRVEFKDIKFVDLGKKK